MDVNTKSALLLFFFYWNLFQVEELSYKKFLVVDWACVRLWELLQIERNWNLEITFRDGRSIQPMR